MIGTRTRQRWLAAISCCALLAGCGRPSGEDAARQSTASAHKPAKAASLVDNMVAAVSAGKSAAALGVYFSLGNSPTQNTALPVDIGIVAHRPFSSLRAFFSAQDGLTLISGDQIEPMSTVPLEKPFEHHLVVMPAKPGVFMITATFETEGEEGTLSRIYSIPVIVAPAQPAPRPSAPPVAPGAAQPAGAPPATRQADTAHK